MAMPQAERIWTRDEVLALPNDGKRYELIDGQLLVSPSPLAVHQLALVALYDLVSIYVRHHGLGVTLLSPADLDLGRGDLSQPDLYVVPEPDRPAELGWRGFAVPLLAVEILSPSTARHDRITKRRRYQQAGVGTYWVADVDAGAIEVWTPGAERPVIADRTVGWQPDPALPPLVIDLERYFRPEWRSGGD
ncbi:MAG: Uma2 family endonuclease [Gemmatimonadales bacterium]|nr:Uma2 family endonuclease [Gemmatimonadales bacterium]